MGLPGETKKDIEDTVNFAAHLKDINPYVYSSFSIYTPFKGTELYDVCVKKNYFVPTRTAKYMKLCFGTINTEEFTYEWLEEMRYKGWLKANHISSEDDLKKSPLNCPWIPNLDDK